MAGVRILVVVALAGWIQLTWGIGTNVALNKPAWMSSAWDANHPAIRAVDGDTRSDHDRYIVHTNVGETSAWWKVDLQTQVQSALVILYFRTDYKKRRNGTQLYTSLQNSTDPHQDRLCHTIDGGADGTDIPEIYNVTCSETWRYLTVYTETDNDGFGAILDFAEVQVWDCASGKYGPNCASDCSSRHCKTSSATCDRVGGQCLDGCQVGWMGADCTTVLVNCSDGRYGPGCSQVCSSRNCKTQSLVCDVTGTCPNGCRDGWQNVDCRTPCPSGKYGSNCSKSCDSRQCETARAACDHVTGTCTVGCREGWIGADCTEKCKLGTFGPDCSRCGHCDVTCNVGDGRCPGECLDGFSGDRCDVDVRVSPVTSGIIGGAVVMVVMLLLIGGLICLLKAGRLKWIPPNGTDPTESSKTDTGYTGEISAHAHISGVNDPDYSELNDVTREREEKSQYDVIQNKVYENNQI